MSNFIPLSVIQFENNALFPLTKICKDPFKNLLPLVHREVHAMRLYSYIGVVDICTNGGSCAKYPYRQFPLIPLVILGYPVVILSGREYRR